MTVYVSVTGFRVARRRHLPLFWWHAIRSMRQAVTAPGNLHAAARNVDGCYHTLTVWQSRGAMQAYLVRGAHAQAMRAHARIGHGRTYGYEADGAPGWEEALDQWRHFGRQVKWSG